MRAYEIALIVLAFPLGVATGIGLSLVRDWLRYWFPRLWPPSGQDDTHNPAMLEGGRGDPSSNDSMALGMKLRSAPPRGVTG